MCRTSYLDSDLGLTRALPHPEHLGALPPGLLVGGERGVAALGRSLALPHLEVLPHQSEGRIEVTWSVSTNHSSPAAPPSPS